jgi:hypothetical protein
MSDHETSSIRKSYYLEVRRNSLPLEVGKLKDTRLPIKNAAQVDAS